MNLLLITSTFPSPLNPRAGAFNETLVAALRKQHHVHVIAPVAWTRVLVRRPLRPSAGLPETSQSDVDFPISFYPPKLLRSTYGGWLWRSIRPSIQRLASRFRPDAVVGYWLHPDGEAALRAARFFGVPGVVISGGSDLRRLPASTARRRAIVRVLRQADRVVVVSEDLRRRAISLGANADRVELMRRGVRKELFYPVDRRLARVAAGLPEDAVVLLWAGRLEPVKNPAMLLYAAREWHRRWGNRLRVLMYGDGSMRSALESLRDELDLRQVLQMEPAVTQHALALRYKAADLTILTSHSEGVPNVLLESIACGTPFVATDVGGVTEIATPGLDALVGDGNIQRLVEAVIQQIENRTAHHGGGHSSFQQRHYLPPDVSVMADQFAALIQNTIDPSQPSSSPASIEPSRPIPTSTIPAYSNPPLPGVVTTALPTVATPNWTEAAG